MLETGVQMGFGREQHNVLEVRVVNMGVNSEESLEDNLDDCFEVAREGHAQRTGEDFFII